jgi:DNA-binding MarR family transcriptional regulator
MTDQTDQQSATIIPLNSAKAQRASERKWGKKVMELGFCIIPSLLLRGQQRLGLNATQLAVLMHLADYWWDLERKPYPTKKTLGERLNIKPRRVQQIIAELEKAGFLRREKRANHYRGQLSNAYDLSGLVAKLRALEPDFRKAEETAREGRRRAAQPGARLRQTVQRPAV